MIYELNKPRFKERMWKKAVKKHGHQLIQKSQSLTYDFSAISAWIFIQ